MINSLNTSGILKSWSHSKAEPGGGCSTMQYIYARVSRASLVGVQNETGGAGPPRPECAGLGMRAAKTNKTKMKSNQEKKKYDLLLPCRRIPSPPVPPFLFPPPSPFLPSSSVVKSESGVGIRFEESKKKEEGKVENSPELGGRQP